MLHTFSVITKSDCPIKHCDHCDSEVYGFLYSEKEKPVFTSKDLTIEHFNNMIAKQIEHENESEPRRKALERIGDHSGDETEFVDTDRSIGSSKSYSVRFSEDFSIASPDSQLISTTTSSRAGTSLESRLDNIQGRPKTGSVKSARSRSNRSGNGSENSSGLNNVQCEVSKGPAHRSNSNLAKPTSRNGSGRISRSRSVGHDGRSNTAQSNTRMPSERRAASALPNIGRGREKVNLPPRPKTSSSMYR